MIAIKVALQPLNYVKVDVRDPSTKDMTKLYNLMEVKLDFGPTFLNRCLFLSCKLSRDDLDRKFFYINILSSLAKLVS